MTAVWFRFNLALALWGILDALEDLTRGLWDSVHHDREPEHEGFTEEFSITDLFAEREPVHLAVEPFDPCQAAFALDPLSPWALAPFELSETTPLFDEVWADFHKTAPEGALAS